MADEKKTQATSKWAGMENSMSALGKGSWVFAVVGAILDIVIASALMSNYNRAMYSAQLNIDNAVMYNQFLSEASSALWFSVVHFAFAGVCAVITVIYLIKPFGASCGAKDWEPLIKDNLGGKISKMWLMAILLACLSYFVGSIGVIFPAAALTFVGPGKGRIFGSQKTKP